MTEWYPCKWCEGEGGWHAHVEPSYSDPGEIIAKLRAELEQSRSQAFEECAKIADDAKFGREATARSALAEGDTDGSVLAAMQARMADVIFQAIRQHSQKGRDND